ncbi:MAG: cyclic nucleotide-binding domain-containing protein [Flavobacteriales bacterium]|nr:cyclic nucleotide-binding domain-containing protein [Flavobacteriales bacterium]
MTNHYLEPRTELSTIQQQDVSKTKWYSNVLFKDFTSDQLDLISPYIVEKDFQPRELIMTDGDEGTFALMVDSGTVTIHKGELMLSERGEGDLVGMMALVDGGPRSATVAAGHKGCTGFIFSKEAFDKVMEHESDSVVSKMLMNYLKYQQSAIRQTNELGLQETRARLAESRKRVMSARFFVQMVLGLIVFVFLLGFLTKAAGEGESTYISFALLAIYGIWSFFYVRLSGLPMDSFGMTMDNFLPALKVTMKWTAGFVVVLFVAKWIMVTFFPNLFGTDIIQLYQSDGGIGATVLVIALYSIHAVIQEFIARGCIQGGLMQFVTGRRSAFTAILVATLMFSSFHLMIDMKFAVITVIPGLFWGYLFFKERNILALSISHIIIGVTSIFVLNIVG